MKHLFVCNAKYCTNMPITPLDICYLTSLKTNFENYSQQNTLRKERKICKLKSTSLNT